MDILDNREITLGVLVIGVIAFVASKKSVRSAFRPVWTAFCNKLILIPFGLMTGYIVLVVFGLHAMGLWDMEQLKDTLLWGFSVALLSFFQIPQIAEDEHYFRKAIKDNFKVVAIFEFVVNFFTFPLWAEFIIIPAATLLVTAQAVAKTKAEYAPANKLITGLLTFLGWCLVIYTAYRLVTDFSAFATIDTLKDFALPVVLSLLLLPSIFVLALYVNYEKAFMRLNFFIKGIPLRRYAKRVALLRLHVDARLLKRWLDDIARRPPTNRQEVKSSVALAKACALREKHPATVPFAQGWSPYLAREFLTGKGLIAGNYHQGPIDDTQWYASAPYLEIGEGIFPDNVAYYVEGDEHIARRLKLVVNFNNPQSTNETRIQFAGIVEELFRKSLTQEMPDELHASIMTDTPLTLTVSGKTLELASEIWPTGRGHELRLTIQSGAAS